jgi:hypothetical protein
MTKIYNPLSLVINLCPTSLEIRFYSPITNSISSINSSSLITISLLPSTLLLLLQAPQLALPKTLLQNYLQNSPQPSSKTSPKNCPPERLLYPFLYSCDHKPLTLPSLWVLPTLGHPISGASHPAAKVHASSPP